jgi:phage terminase small subunit
VVFTDGCVLSTFTSILNIRDCDSENKKIIKKYFKKFEKRNKKKLKPIKKMDIKLYCHTYLLYMSTINKHRNTQMSQLEYPKKEKTKTENNKINIY